MANALLVSFIGLLGILIGALFTRSREREKHRKERVANAYADYMGMQAALDRPEFSDLFVRVMRGHELSSDEAAVFNIMNERMAKAHAMILIYAAPNVVRAMSDFYNHVHGVTSKESFDAYAKLVAEMRKDSEAAYYDGFEGHIDNIVGSGPLNRRLLRAEALRKAETK